MSRIETDKIQDSPLSGVIIMTPGQLEEFASRVREQTIEVIAEALPEVVQSALSPHMTSREVMKMTGWSGAKLQRLRDSREVEYVQNGRSISYPRRQMLAYIRGLTVEGKFTPPSARDKYAGKPSSLGKMLPKQKNTPGPEMSTRQPRGDHEQPGRHHSAQVNH